MSDWKERLKIEYQELNEKLEKLNKSLGEIDCDELNISMPDIVLLNMQSAYMGHYLDILELLFIWPRRWDNMRKGNGDV